MILILSIKIVLIIFPHTYWTLPLRISSVLFLHAKYYISTQIPQGDSFLELVVMAHILYGMNGRYSKYDRGNIFKGYLPMMIIYVQGEFWRLCLLIFCIKMQRLSSSHLPILYIDNHLMIWERDFDKVLFQLW